MSKLCAWVGLELPFPQVSASQVARVVGMSLWCPAQSLAFKSGYGDIKHNAGDLEVKGLGPSALKRQEVLSNHSLVPGVC
jgi:hypothetical protein